MSVAQKQCKIDGCNGIGVLSRYGARYFIKGYCQKHYQRQRNNIPLDTSVYERRPSIIEGNIAKILLGIRAKDGYTIVDKADSWLDEYKWTKNRSGYASAYVNGKLVRMHQIIIGKKAGLDIDHINQNKLDNRRSNLRHVTRGINMLNKSITSKNKTGYRGVYVNTMKSKGKYYCSLTVNGKRVVKYGFNKLDVASEWYQNTKNIMIKERYGTN